MKKMFSLSFTSHLFFPSYSLLETLLQECPFLIRFGPFGQDCRAQGEKYKHEMEHGWVAPVAICFVNEQIGYGLFAAKDIKKGQWVGEYTGAIRLVDKKLVDLNPYCFHYPTKLWSRNYYVIDAKLYGNEMRFLNHSDTPNLSPVCLFDRSMLHQVFFAKRDIQEGEELSFDYGIDFWRLRKKFGERV